MNISALKTGMISWVKPEIAKASSLCHSTEVFLTVTIETSFLSPEEIITATKICMDGGADSIKTNSGIYNNSTELSIFHLIKSLTQNQCEIKTYSNLEGLGSAIKLIENGVDQITTPHNPLEFVLTI
jgi:deoxyribose-phosphate aldolase